MPLSIAYKELFPIVLAVSLWGHQWFAKRVDFCSDNKAVVEVLRSHTSRDSNLMVLLRLLFRVKHSSAPKGLSNNFSILKKCKSKFDCLVFQMFFINELRPSLNVQSDSLRAKAFK